MTLGLLMFFGAVRSFKALKKLKDELLDAEKLKKDLSWVKIWNWIIIGIIILGWAGCSLFWILSSLKNTPVFSLLRVVGVASILGAIFLAPFVVVVFLQKGTTEAAEGLKGEPGLGEGDVDASIADEADI